ncbi:MAG TPA: isoprenylcysteine carboxylmethyltransferase family protein [Acetobacteraceae bacterium]|nr:isoprenylcysteine carboxylmethyltransferase family protein [Acetobacteraceae bacterium]
MRLVVQTLLWLAAMGAILFLGAGEWRWPQGWIYLAEVGISAFAVSVWLLRHDPALLASRLSAPVRRDQKPWDRLFMAAILAAFVAWMALIGLDARRFQWSEVPAWVQALGAALVALSLVLCWQVFRFNSFAAPQVRVQSGQRVVSDGPYRIVRHPMYSSAVWYFLGTPLLLGSWWGLLAVPLFIAGLSVRTMGEERMLRRELAGYDEYAKRVRYRLVPGLW